MRPGLLRAAVLVLVLSVGVVIGAGPLQHSNSERDRQLDAQRAEVAEKQRRIEALESGSAFAEAYAAATAPTLVRDVLTGRSVALLTLPGADPDVVEKVTSLVATAQGKVTARLALAPAAARASGRQLIEALTSQMLTSQAQGVTVPTGANGYERLGVLLARAVGSGPTGQPAQAAYDPTAVGIVSGLESAELVEVVQPVAARAGLVLVVTGGAAERAGSGETAVPVTVLGAFGAQVPTVVVGPTDAAREGGLLAAIRAGTAGRVSTVDSAETAMGRVVTVLALAARARGTVGQYGGVGAADGVVPAAG